MAKNTEAKKAKKEKKVVSLEDEQRLRDRTFEVYAELDQLRSKPIRNEQEQRRYEQLKSQYSAMYEEYAGKYAIIMEADKKEKPEDEKPKSKKIFRTLLISVGAMALFVAAIVVCETFKRVDEEQLEDLTRAYVEWDGEQTAIGEGYKIVDEDAEDEGGKVLDDDARVPDLTKAENTDQLPERRHFSWTGIDGATVMTWTPQLYKETFDAYRAAERYRDSNQFDRYISDSNNERLLLEISETLQSIGHGMGYSDWETVCEAVNFVQNIPFVTDLESVGQEEWPKYVTETIYDECGDCEDKAILLAGILKSMGYDAVLIAFDGHLGVGIAGSDSMDGVNYESNGKKYFYIEPSYPGWEIGQIPDNVDSGQVAIVPI